VILIIIDYPEFLKFMHLVANRTQEINAFPKLAYGAGLSNGINQGSSRLKRKSKKKSRVGQTRIESC
jgi:hypothetical protein